MLYTLFYIVEKNALHYMRVMVVFCTLQERNSGMLRFREPGMTVLYILQEAEKGAYKGGI